MEGIELTYSFLFITKTNWCPECSLRSVVLVVMVVVPSIWCEDIPNIISKCFSNHSLTVKSQVSTIFHFHVLFRTNKILHVNQYYTLTAAFVASISRPQCFLGVVVMDVVVVTPSVWWVEKNIFTNTCNFFKYINEIFSPCISWTSICHKSFNVSSRGINSIRFESTTPHASSYPLGGQGITVYVWPLERPSCLPPALSNDHLAFLLASRTIILPYPALLNDPLAFLLASRTTSCVRS